MNGVGRCRYARQRSYKTRKVYENNDEKVQVHGGGIRNHRYEEVGDASDASFKPINALGVAQLTLRRYWNSKGISRGLGHDG